MKVTIRSAAHEDILRQYRYFLIEKDAAAVAERFLDAVQLAVKALARNPGMGVRKRLKASELANLRSWPVPGFPAMRVYYLYEPGTLRIVRVLHGKRDLNPLLEDSLDED